MKPRTFNLVAAISLEFKEPEKVKRLILNYMVSNIDHIKATNVKLMIQQHFLSGVALKEVHDMANKLAAKIQPCQAQTKARAKIERSTMLTKLEDAKRKEVKTRRYFIYCKEEMSKFVRKGTYARECLMEQVKAETESLWRKEREKAKMKFQRNREKQSKMEVSCNNVV